MKSSIALGLLLLGAVSLEAGPSAQTEREFARFVAAREAAREKTLNGPGFLWIDQFPELAAAARRGQTITRAVVRNPVDVTGGMVHDWIGAAFIPGATLNSTLAFVQDYGNHKNVYLPEVVDSHIVSHHGDEYLVYLRLRKQKVITVILNSEHDIKYTRVDSRHAYSRSYSTRISEVGSPGTSSEHELPADADHGFLWRLNSYWRFEERDGGVWIECEAISLTRDVPFGLGGLIKPILRELPMESLEKTLSATRASISKLNRNETGHPPLASNPVER